MSIESLRKYTQELVKEVEVDGHSYKLRKFSAKAYMEFLKQRESTPDDFGVYILLVSKSLCDDAGNLDCDTDEGRELLSRLPVNGIRLLGEAAIEWAIGRDPGEEKKSLPPSNSATSSA